MKNILVPVDFSDATERVVSAAAELAKALKADVSLLHVAAPEPDFIGYKPGPQTVRDAVAEKLHEEHRKLHDLDHRLEKQGLKVTSLVIQGYTVDKILKEAERTKADLIVMGSHGHGALYHLLTGSVTEGVLRKAPCPVLVVTRTTR